MSETICEIPLEHFSKRPTPLEIAKIFLNFGSDDQAKIFNSIAKDMGNWGQICKETQWLYIIDGLDESAKEMIRFMAIEEGETK